MASQFSSSVPDRRVPQWRVEYEAALREGDHERLFKRIEVAEAAILTRRDVLEQGSDGSAERREITLALAKLESMKKEVLKFL